MNDRRKTLLLITTSYPMSGDGSEAAGAFVADLAQALLLFANVRVVAPGKDETVESLEGGRLEVWRFASGERPLSLLPGFNPLGWLAIIRVLRSMTRQAMAAARDEAVDHSLALWVLPSGWIARILRRRCGIPYSVWALGSDIWVLGRISFLRIMLRSVIRGAAKSYADGYRLVKDTMSISGSQTEFLPSTRRLGCSPRVVFRSGAPYRYIFLGRWHPNKGVDLFLEALRLLTNDEWQGIESVNIYGGGPLEALVRRAALELHALGRPVQAHGYVGTQMAEQVLGQADILVLPSRIESIPVVFSDAMKARIPVVATPVGDLPELLSNGTGWLCRAVDAEAIRDAIVESMRSDMSSYAEALAASAEIFDIEAIAARLARDVVP